MSTDSPAQPQAAPAPHPLLQRGALAIMGTMGFLIVALSVQLVRLTLAEPMETQSSVRATTVSSITPAVAR
ncbi:MAG TPA: hypothetical protein VNK43_13265 [Gemmatimonadales bacterium]|nr:hypothetical protein [Gemmatimonadales bacterium]